MIFHALNGFIGLEEHICVYLGPAFEGNCLYLRGRLNGCLHNCSHVESILC